MTWPERFWWVVTWASVAWYLTVTVYVSIRGGWDIRRMLERLDEQNRN
ncbi:MAG: hypothetical protein JNM18_26125 [Planctomycetaceae bacterium]|nr:hypothetical protein [Planctomycetaceae bacterium]